MNNCIMLCDAAPAAPAPAAPAAAPAQQSGFGMMVPMLLILAIFYFMMGGIIGTIVEATEKTFKVETSNGTEMEILRSCVQGVVTPEGAAEAK